MRILAIAAALYATIAPAAAHHSFAMFDQQKTIELTGIVDEFRWTNPHCFTVLIVDGERWVIEMSPPKALRVFGFAPDILRSGMQVRLTIHPLRSDIWGGHFVRAVLPDGTEIGEIDKGGPGAGEWPPQAEP